MNVGIVCYASIGGSGIIATELGKALAARGHRVHILSGEMPARFGDYQPGLAYHRVEPPSYPVFREPQYLLALTSKIVQVSLDEGLDIVHAHYAIPHATAACLARQIIAVRHGGAAPRGDDAAPARISRCSGPTRHARRSSRSDRTVGRRHRRVPQPARRHARALGVSCDIRVIHNHRLRLHQRRDAIEVRRKLAPHGEAISSTCRTSVR
jgi:glycosyltransferase involved in cell wall biosynthesis